MSDFFYRLFRPSFWLLNNPYSAQWDRILNASLEKHGVVLIDNYHARVGDLTIWIRNYPYHFACLTLPSGKQVRPSVRTISKIKAALYGQTGADQRFLDSLEVKT